MEVVTADNTKPEEDKAEKGMEEGRLAVVTADNTKPEEDKAEKGMEESRLAVAGPSGLQVEKNKTCGQKVQNGSLLDSKKQENQDHQLTGKEKMSPEIIEILTDSDVEEEDLTVKTVDNFLTESEFNAVLERFFADGEAGPVEVLNAIDVDNEIRYLAAWAVEDRVVGMYLTPNYILKQFFPQHLINFFEERITWVENGNLKACSYKMNYRPSDSDDSVEN